MAREFLPQLVLTGTIKDNAAGGETLSFTIPFGPLQIICIANIPMDDDTEAPCYVKFKLDLKSTQDQLDRRRPRSNGSSPHQNGHRTEVSGRHPGHR
jgi:hypothetical protein